jgi:hypothetical protein
MIQIFTTNFPPQNTPAVDQNDTITQPFMAFFRDLYNRTGGGNGLVNKTGTYAAGGPLTTDWNLLTSTSGVTLPALTGGQNVFVTNQSLGNVTVTPPAGATIDGNPTYTLPNAKSQIYWFFSATQIISTQLG